MYCVSVFKCVHARALTHTHTHWLCVNESKIWNMQFTCTYVCAYFAYVRVNTHTHTHTHWLCINESKIWNMQFTCTYVCAYFAYVCVNRNSKQEYVCMYVYSVCIMHVRHVHLRLCLHYTTEISYIHTHLSNIYVHARMYACKSHFSHTCVHVLGTTNVYIHACLCAHMYACISHFRHAYVHVLVT